MRATQMGGMGVQHKAGRLIAQGWLTLRITCIVSSISFTVRKHLAITVT